jgi:4-amino-4-deoxy-L-arabinose transferase-like glycosyltransferase
VNFTACEVMALLETKSGLCALVFGAAILATLLFWTVLPARYGINELTDYIGFHEPVARNIVAGHGLIVREGEPAILFPPGYPLLLAGIFKVSDLLNAPEQLLLSVFILISVGLTSVFVFDLAQSIWGPRPALVSALIWMTHPFALWLTKQPNTETPFMAVLFGGFYLFWDALRRKSHSWSLYLLSGILIGFAMLIRPIALWVGVLMAAMLWMVGREMTVRLRLFLGAMVLLGNLVAILPWEAWIYFKMDRFVLLGTVGQGSLTRGLTFHAFPENYRNVVSDKVSILLQDIERRSDQVRSFGGIISVWADEFRTRPLTLATVFALKAARSWFGTDSGQHEVLLVLIQIPYMALLLWASYRAWSRGGIARQLTLGIWLIVLYFWTMSTLGIAMVRYMIPPMGLLTVLVPSIFYSQKRQTSFFLQPQADLQNSNDSNHVCQVTS